jgi:hypothetical protein
VSCSTVDLSRTLQLSFTVILTLMEEDFRHLRWRRDEKQCRLIISLPMWRDRIASRDFAPVKLWAILLGSASNLTEVLRIDILAVCVCLVLWIYSIEDCDIG